MDLAVRRRVGHKVFNCTGPNLFHKYISSKDTTELVHHIHGHSGRLTYVCQRSAQIVAAPENAIITDARAYVTHKATDDAMLCVRKGVPVANQSAGGW